MLIPNHLSTLGSGTSSLRPQVFRIHRPVIKDKYRSVVPTASSLLVNIVKLKHSIELMKDELLNVHSMEAQTRTHEIPERPTSLDGFIKANSECGSRYSTCSCLRSHRTEDIPVREDEDGIRSHFCPLIKELDMVRDEDEDYPDQPLKFEFDVDLIFNGCNLKSEEIPCLVAEKPTLSEFEEVNGSSDVDATTSMIYALTQNRQPMEDSVTLEYLCEHKAKYFPTQRMLDAKTMNSWIEESSDDTESYPSDRETEMTWARFKDGDESDMEEFEETPVNENDSVALKYRFDHEEEDEIYKDILKRNEIPNIVITDESEGTVEQSNGIDIQSIDFEKNNREISSGLENYDGSELHGDISKQNFETDKQPELTGDQGENNDSPKSDVGNEPPAQTRLCTSRENTMYQNPSTDSLDKKPLQETEAPEACISEDLKFNKTDAPTSNGVTEFSNTGKNESKPKKESKIQNILKESQEFDVRKEDKMDNLAMEPMDMHSPRVSIDEETQPDLATALRFMTEIYHTKDEEELYSDTLSTIDLPSEVPKTEKSADSLISRNYQDIPLDQTTGRTVDATSPSKSISFDPVLSGDKKTGKRSRNKFSKFFQSFKRRLAKKM